MKTKFLSILGGIFLAHALQAQDNLIKDGGFEKGGLDFPWEEKPAQSASVMSPGLGKTAHLLQFDPSEEQKVVWQCFPTTGGSWTFSMLFRSDELPEETRSLTLVLGHEDAPGNILKGNITVSFWQVHGRKGMIPAFFMEKWEVIPGFASLEYGTTYRIVIEGKDYGTPEASYTIEVLDEESQLSIAKSQPLTIWRGFPPLDAEAKGLKQVLFYTNGSAGASFQIDDVCVK